MYKDKYYKYKCVQFQVTSACAALLRVLFASDVKEKTKSIITFIPAKIAFKWVGSIGVVVHVNSVHCAILKRYSTKFTGVEVRKLFGPGDGHQARHLSGLLL